MKTTHKKSFWKTLLNLGKKFFLNNNKNKESKNEEFIEIKKNKFDYTNTYYFQFSKFGNFPKNKTELQEILGEDLDFWIVKLAYFFNIYKDIVPTYKDRATVFCIPTTNKKLVSFYGSSIEVSHIIRMLVKIKGLVCVDNSFHYNPRIKKQNFCRKYAYNKEIEKLILELNSEINNEHNRVLDCKQNEIKTNDSIVFPATFGTFAKTEVEFINVLGRKSKYWLPRIFKFFELYKNKLQEHIQDSSTDVPIIEFSRNDIKLLNTSFRIGASGIIRKLVEIKCLVPAEVHWFSRYYVFNKKLWKLISDMNLKFQRIPIVEQTLFNCNNNSLNNNIKTDCLYTDTNIQISNNHPINQQNSDNKTEETKQYDVSPDIFEGFPKTKKQLLKALGLKNDVWTSKISTFFESYKDETDDSSKEVPIIEFGFKHNKLPKPIISSSFYKFKNILLKIKAIVRVENPNDRIKYYGNTHKKYAYNKELEKLILNNYNQQYNPLNFTPSDFGDFPKTKTELLCRLKRYSSNTIFKMISFFEFFKDTTKDCDYTEDPSKKVPMIYINTNNNLLQKKIGLSSNRMGSLRVSRLIKELIDIDALVCVDNSWSRSVSIPKQYAYNKAMEKLFLELKIEDIY